MSEFDFGDLFREFRVESAQSGFTIVNGCWNHLRENKDYIDSTDSYTISNSILSILDKNETINTSESIRNLDFAFRFYLLIKNMNIRR